MLVHHRAGAVAGAWVSDVDTSQLVANAERSCRARRAGIVVRPSQHAHHTGCSGAWARYRGWVALDEAVSRDGGADLAKG
jgi:hypothetical protein